jgi:separase
VTLTQSPSASYMPPKALTAKRPTSTRAVRTAKKTEDVEDLAHQLATRLTISKSKEKQTAIPDLLPQDNPNASMRAVNTASQKLSALTQTGWTVAKDGGTSKQGEEAMTCARSIKKNLDALRKVTTPSPLDLERAALSAVGKLLTLQLVRPPIIVHALLVHRCPVRPSLGYSV